MLKTYGVENVFIIGFDVKEQNLECLLRNDFHFSSKKPEFQGNTFIKGLYRFLTEEGTSQLNMDIPLEIYGPENFGVV